MQAGRRQRSWNTKFKTPEEKFRNFVGKGEPAENISVANWEYMNTFKGHGVDEVKEAADVWVLDVDTLKWILLVHVELIGLPKRERKKINPTLAN